MTLISKKASINAADNLVLICGKDSGLSNAGLTKDEISYLRKRIAAPDKKLVSLSTPQRHIFMQVVEEKKDRHTTLELLRKMAAMIHTYISDSRLTAVTIVDLDQLPEETLAFAEGLVLSNYQFLKYKRERERELSPLRTISLVSAGVPTARIEELNVVLGATYITRDLVNEPASFLTATQLSKEFRRMGKDAGFEVEVLNKAKISALKMGGLLAVNLGSQEPPTFTIMQYKPKNAKNKKPVVLVGKGVVYDTGGVSLKPTPNSMDMMKCDMAGAAAVAGAIYAAAKAKLPVHIIALVPATDNRPGENAYVPGDVITMYNGMTVEMLNADAEGRMILADALSYARKFDPMLVLDFATLTGAAVAAIGTSGIVAMGTAPGEVKAKICESGNNTFERIAEMPFWEDYDDLIKSDIADMKNIGGPYAGSITAGKFLARYIDYPWMHFDIAGPAFLTARDGYRVKGGTGVGVRLLFDYFKNNF
jgi:leucyl aminopeptidase